MAGTMNTWLTPYPLSISANTCPVDDTRTSGETTIEALAMSINLSELRPRSRPAGISGRASFPLPEALQRYVERARASLAEPFVGLTTDGQVMPGLFRLERSGVSAQPLLDAADAFVESLSPEQRGWVSFPIDSSEWRAWSNISPYLLRHGVCLESLSDAQRDLALGLVKESLSSAGFQTARDVMRLNETIAEMTGRFHEYGEWLYWLSIFGTPSSREPWGWQIDGHHLILNCFVLGDQVVTTPQFMGSEPVYAEQGKYAGTRVFEREESIGFDFMRGLSAEQQARATVGMQLPLDAVATAPHDNIRVPYEGLPCADLSAAQQSALVDLISLYIARLPPGHAAVRLAEIQHYAADTYFAWIGACDDAAPFYYRIHSPVVWIEFDHQIGIALDNDVPSRNHVHTIVRTPNGNDYGHDLLRQHYQRHHARRS
jgi:Protein of unknown function (DUF3500)